LSEFTTVISIINENSENLKGVRHVKIQSTIDNSIYTFQDVLKKGKGLVVIEKISKGMRILFKEPIIIIPYNIPVIKR
jgi:hypothetical protein